MRRVVKRFGIEFVFVPGLGLMLLRKGQFGIAPRSRLHRPFVVRLLVLGLGAIALVNSRLNAALLSARACAGFFHRCSPPIFRKRPRAERSRWIMSRRVWLSMRHFAQRFQ